MDNPGLPVPHQCTVMLVHSFFHLWRSTADASSLLRCSPDHDATNGFFVSCFVRNNNASKKRKDIEEERPDGSGSKRKKKKKKSK